MEPAQVGAAIREAREARKWTQEYLARMCDTDQSTVGRTELGQFKRLTVTIYRMIEVLGIRPPGADPRGLDIVVQSRQPTLPEPPSAEMDVFGTAEGGAGALILTADAVDTVQRPPSLANVRGAYGVLITGTSMVPAFKPGEVALVNPHLPPRADDDVVLQRDDNGTRYGIIKTFVRELPDEWKLMQWNPKKMLARSKQEWPQCHVVVGKYSRL